VRRLRGSRLAALGVEPWITPRGGFFLWCRLPEGADAARVARSALAEKVILAPGNVFSVTQTASEFMRFNVAQMGDARVYDTLRLALKRA
jgi:DNA-binding transcriptional MocR family regulator